MRILSLDPGQRHLALCIIESTTRQIDLWTLVKLDTLTPMDVKEHLDAILEPHTYAIVLIERQPPRNHSMTKLECWLHMYFVMSGHPVRLVHASNKIGYEKGRTYYQRKKASVATLREYMETHPQSSKMCDVFENAPKKDDLADCVLQALAYINTL